MGAKNALAFVCALILSTIAAWSAPLRIVVISDMNSSYGSTTYEPRIAVAIDAIIALKPDLVISTGDMVAGQRRPHLSEDEVLAMWKSFHQTVSDPLAAVGIPFAVTPGNHDASAYSGFERERRIYATEWSERTPNLSFVKGGNYPFHYAFDLGGVRFASLDATIIGRLDRDQKNWLSEVMQTAGEARIVFSHLPLWPIAKGRETEVIGDAELAELFKKTDVDLQLSGHHHAFYPGAMSGVAYVSQACLGAGPRAIIGTSAKTEPGFTVLEISEDGVIAIYAAVGASFDKRLVLSSLPAEIRTPLATLQRLDLADLPDVRMDVAE